MTNKSLGVVPHSELAMHLRIAGKPIERYEIVSCHNYYSVKVWILNDHTPITGLISELLPFEIREKIDL